MRGAIEFQTFAKRGREYWIKASMAEAYAGLDDAPKAQELLEAARAVDLSAPSLESVAKTTTEPARSVVREWMIESTADQLARLKLRAMRARLFTAAKFALCAECGTEARLFSQARSRVQWAIINVL